MPELIAPQWTPPALHNLTPIQKRALRDEAHRFIMLCGGRRSRKSLISKRKMIVRALRTPGGRFFHAAPTWAQAVEIFWEHPDSNLKRDTQGFWREKPSESTCTVYLLNGAQICIHSLDRAYRMEGRPWHGFHITEYPNAKPGIWEANLRPLLADTKGWAIIDGVPDMHSPVSAEYKALAKHACGGVIPETVPLEGAYGENPADPDWAFYSWFSSDVLAADELEKLQRTTDPKIYSQEYEGSFEKLSGLVYYAYRAEQYPEGNHDESIKYNPSLPLYIGMDFNVDPMSAVVGQLYGKQKLLLHRGYFLRDSNTEELITRIITEHREATTFYITPCQSSSARQTVAALGQTDISIIKNACDRAGKVCRLHRRTKNPLIKNRLNATNSMLHAKQLRINPSDPGLKELIKDWDSIAWKPGTSELNIENPMRGHISAALDYLVEYYFPVTSGVGAGYLYEENVIV